MNIKLVFCLTMFVLLSSLPCIRFGQVKVNAFNDYRVHNLNTGLNYTTIQDAIDAPETMSGHTIFVNDGTYYEHIVLNKSPSLIGENRSGTFIDGNGTGTLIWVTANSVSISGFTFCNSGRNYSDCSILIENSQDNNVTDNVITGNLYGVKLVNSTDNELTDNVAFENSVAINLWNSSYNKIMRNNIDSANNSGVALWQDSSNNIIQCNNVSHSNCTGIYTNKSDNNTIAFNNLSFNEGGIFLTESSCNILTGNNITSSTMSGLALRNVTNSGIYFNTIAQNPYGITTQNITYDIFVGNTIADNEYNLYLGNSSNNNFYDNNFILKSPEPFYNIQALIYNSSLNSWDNGLEGNYWSDYAGKDSDRDGIGNTPHVICKIDANNQDNYPLMGTFSSFNTTIGYNVNIISNSTIEDFQYFESNSTIKLYVSNMTTNQTFDFCRICIPYTLMNVNKIAVIIDDGLTPVLYYNYILYDNGTHRWVYFSYEHSTHEIIIVSEFPSFLILPLFMTATLLVIIGYRRKNFNKWNSIRQQGS